MPVARFTNVPQNGFTPSWNTTSRQYAPYAAKGKFTNLTEKERLARRIRTSNMSGAGGYGGPSSMGGGSNTALSGNSSFFSPQLSTDFLELPQSLREKREIYRHFYNSDPLVGQAIDLHTELPLSKVRLSTPKPSHCPPGFRSADNYGKYILDFFERMCDKIDLFKRLLTLTHHYWLDGNCVSGDVLVSTRSGEVPIKQVLVGDEVLTNKGRWKSVEAVMQRESEGLIAIKVSRLPDTIDVTSEHPMETLRGDSWKFVLASEVKKGDYLRVTWPTITSDLVSIDLLKGVPGVKLVTKNSYSIIRKCSHLRDERAVRARSKLLSWLSSLESPTIRTRKSLAKEFGVDLPTLNNVIITLDSEFGSGYRKRIGPVGFSKGSQTVWYSTNEVRCSSEHYTINREYYFSAKPSIQVDQDFLYLVGYWLGDGTLSRDSKRMSWGRGIWNICFGRDSRPQYTRVKEILTNKLGADCIRESVDSVGMRTIYVKHHPAFIEWWSTQFGGTSHGLNPKRIPAWVSQLPADKTLAFIAGIVDSDGCVSVSKCKKGIVSIGLTSRNLIFSIRDLLLRVGVVPSLRVSDTKDGLIGSQVIKANHQVYYLTVESRDQCCLVTSMSLKGKNIRPDTKFVKGHPSYRVLADGTVGFLVSDVSNISSGTVYNLQVSEDSTFRAGFVSTHNCFIFAEDSSVDIPVDVGHRVERRPMAILNEDGTGTETEEEIVETYSDREERDLAYYQKHYKGWSKLVILPIDQVKLTTFSFTDKVRIELIPSDRDKVLFTQAKAGDERAQEMVEEIPAEVREYIESGKLIPLGTDADEGSFCYHLAARRGAGEDLGASILDRCLRCHLPGTPVLVQRNGFITQVSIETLDPDTDLVLGHTGIWRGFEVGIRPIDEEVSIIRVAKLHLPIACTKEHKYFVLRRGKVIDVLAGDIRPGDALQVPQLPLTESMSRFDLSLDFDGTSKEYISKKSGSCVTQTTEICEVSDTNFTVMYSKPETSNKMQKHLSNLVLAADWLQELSGPTTIRALKFCTKFGFNHNSLDQTLEKLVNLGARFEVIGRPSFDSSAFDLLFYPSPISDVQLERVTQKTFSRWLDLNSDLGYFVGYWLGDGYIAKKDDIDYGCLGITFGNTEPASVLSIEKQIKPTLDNLGVSWSETQFKKTNGSNISGYQDAFIRWLANNFGHTSEDKHLPSWIFDAPKDFLSGLLRGFVDSDGDVVTKKDGSISVRFNGTNRSLMDQVFLICTSFGIPASSTKPTKERWVKQANGQLSWAKPLYAVHFTHGPSVKKLFDTGFLAKKKVPDSWKDGRSGSRHIEHAGKLYYRVSEVGTATHTGPVYSLNVHEDHTFFAGLAATRNCLYYREKLRQAQTLIASRAMTPKRLIWGEGLSEPDVEDLREQVDLALVDPDYSIITNYEVHWEDIGARDRLLDLSTEYEITDKQLFAGLGVTESLLNGESTFSGDRVKLEVLNTRYVLFREMIQEYVEKYLFRPVARRKGFVEQDEWGNEVVLYPKLSFTRLALRDSQDTYDALFNLYQKGSLSIDVILELFNIDPQDTKEKLERDMFTINDSTFNEVLRGIYGEVGRKLVDETDVAQKISEYLHLKKNPAPPAESENRFG